MSEKIGPLSLKKDEAEVFLGRDIVRQHNYSNETARNIDEEIKRIMNDAYFKAKNILIENKTVLDRIAELLIKNETIDGTEIDRILKEVAAGA